jgi:hypothetical protein
VGLGISGGRPITNDVSCVCNDALPCNPSRYTDASTPGVWAAKKMSFSEVPRRLPLVRMLIPVSATCDETLLMLISPDVGATETKELAATMEEGEY